MKPQKRGLGFTLVELLVVISIIGVLMAVMLPAVQYSRESARRTTCTNHLRNQALALHNFHDANREFPPGRNSFNRSDHSWCTYALPYLEQSGVYERIDLDRRWDDPRGNLAATRAVLPVFRCPSSRYEEPGDTDYGGITGSHLTGAGTAEGFRNGVLVEVTRQDSRPIRFADITDGVSNTVFVGESPDRTRNDHGNWADGMGVFSHENGGVTADNGGIFSWHAAGAYVARVDGSVVFLTTSTDRFVVGALCTRNGGESVCLDP